MRVRGRKGLGGTISILGDFVMTANNFPIGELFELNRTLVGGQVHVQQHWGKLLEKIRAGELKRALELFSHRFELEQLPEAYAMMDKQRDGCIKPLLHVRQN